MTEQWLYDYYMNRLRLAAEEFVQHSQLAHEITEPTMHHQLQQARQYDIDCMLALCRRIKQMKQQ